MYIYINARSYLFSGRGEEVVSRLLRDSRAINFYMIHIWKLGIYKTETYISFK